MYFLMLFTALFLAFFDLQLMALPIKTEVHAENAIVMSAATGRILYAKNASVRQYPASITKIAVCIYALEHGSHLLDTKIVANSESLCSISGAKKAEQNYGKYPSYRLENEASHAGIKVGEAVSLRDLLHALMLVSGGDAANIIADYFGSGSIPNFMEQLNQFLRSIGCVNTHFCNPSGLHHPDHYSTATDIAVFCRYAMRNALFRDIVSKSSYEKAATNKQPAITLFQKNRLLRRGAEHYPYAVGIKTGWHSIALHNVAAAAEKEGRLLIAVLLHSQQRKEVFLDAKKLFEECFTEKKVSQQFLAAGQQSFSRSIDGSNTVLTTYSTEPLFYSYYPSEEPQIACQLIWNKVQLPIRPSTQVGELLLLADKQLVAKVPLYAENLVEKTWVGMLYDKCMEFRLSCIAFIGILFLLLLSAVTKKAKSL